MSLAMNASGAPPWLAPVDAHLAALVPGSGVSIVIDLVVLGQAFAGARRAPGVPCEACGRHRGLRAVARLLGGRPGHGPAVVGPGHRPGHGTAGGAARRRGPGCCPLALAGLPGTSTRSRSWTRWAPADHRRQPGPGFRAALTGEPIKTWDQANRRAGPDAGSGGKAGRDPSAAARWPPSSIAKDFLGVAMTLAIIGAIVLQATNRLASPCGAGPNPRPGPGACSGVSALADHAERGRDPVRHRLRRAGRCRLRLVHVLGL